MTYCCAFKYLDSIFLYSDSALSIEAEVNNLPATTSFGEKTVTGKNESIYESMLKIFEISSQCFVAIAGCVDRAIEFVRILKQAHKNKQDFEKTIVDLNNTLFGAENPKDRVELIIANYDKAGAKLYKWNSANRNLIVQHEYCGIGSLPDDYAKPIIRLQSFLTESNNIYKDALLVGMAAGLQSVSIKENFLTKHNVGGAITGVEINQTGSNWLDDTAYILTGDDGVPSGYVLLLNRPNGFSTKSSFDMEPRYFTNTATPMDHNAWLKKWKTSIDHVFSLTVAKNWVFMNTSRNLIVIVQSKHATSKTSVSQVVMRKGSKQIKLHDAVVAITSNPRGNGIFIFPDSTAKRRIEAVATREMVFQLLQGQSK